MFWTVTVVSDMGYFGRWLDPLPDSAANLHTWLDCVHSDEDTLVSKHELSALLKLQKTVMRQPFLKKKKS